MELKKEREEKNNRKVSDFNPYDMGTYENFIQVFGKNQWTWFIPIIGDLTCDGIRWPKFNPINRN